MDNDQIRINRAGRIAEAHDEATGKAAVQVAKDNNMAAMLQRVHTSKALEAAYDADNYARLYGATFARRLYTRIALAGAMAADRAAVAEWATASATLSEL